MTIQEIMEVVATGYPRESLEDYFDFNTGKERQGCGDTLAQFIVRRVIANYYSDMSTEDQLEDLDRTVWSAIHELQCFHRAIKKALRESARNAL